MKITNLLLVGGLAAGAFILFNKPKSNDDVMGGGGYGSSDPLSSILSTNPLADFFKSGPAKDSKPLTDILGGFGAQPLNQGGGLPVSTKSTTPESPASLLSLQADMVNGQLQKDILQQKTNARGDVTVSVRDDISKSWGPMASNQFISNTVGAGNPAIYGAGRTNIDGSITSFNVPFGAKKDGGYYTPVSSAPSQSNSLVGKYQSLQSTASGFSNMSSGGQSNAPIPGSGSKKDIYQSTLNKSGGGGFR